MTFEELNFINCKAYSHGGAIYLKNSFYKADINLKKINCVNCFGPFGSFIHIDGPNSDKTG